MLFDRKGHVKLADFGSCYRLNENGLVDSQVAAGTPEYIAPEVLQNNEGVKGTCGKESDWWSVGIVLYEMLNADPPFTGDTNVEIFGMIMNHEVYSLFLIFFFFFFHLSIIFLPFPFLPYFFHYLSLSFTFIFLFLISLPTISFILGAFRNTLSSATTSNFRTMPKI